MRIPSRRGQSLIEVTIGIGIGVLFIVAAVGAVTLSLRLDLQNKYTQTASELAQELIEQLATVANDDWHNLDLRPHGPANVYKLDTSTGIYVVYPGGNTVTLDGVSYTVSFIIEDVNRDGLDALIDPPSGTLDPSTLKVTASVSWNQQGEAVELKLSHYLTRTRDRIWRQTDWSQGEGIAGPVIASVPVTDSFAKYFNEVNVKTSTVGELTIDDLNNNLQSLPGNGIDAVYRYAWNDVIGWIDFLYYNNVIIDSTISGYAFSSVGQIALDCATSPNGNICATPPGVGTSDFSVTKSTSGTAAGTLRGYAWNDVIGWISFNCDHTQDPNPGANDCATGGSGLSDYNVSIDSSGYFQGWAWNDIIGWISFNCDHTADSYGQNTCLTGGSGSSDYAVRTGSVTVSVGTLESSTFDTERADGAAWNTVFWRGTKPSGTNIRFQIATSNCENGATDAPSCATSIGWGGTKTDGDGAFVGPDTTSVSVYSAIDQDLQIRLSRAAHNNRRYLRYLIRLESNPARDTSPTVEDAIINWSH